MNGSPYKSTGLADRSMVQSIARNIYEQYIAGEGGLEAGLGNNRC